VAAATSLAVIVLLAARASGLEEQPVPLGATISSGVDAPRAADARSSPPCLGLVRPARQATIAAPVDGVLMDVRVEEGQRVSAGEVLAVMDDRVARASVELALIRSRRSGAVREAESALSMAKQIQQRLTDAAVEYATTPFELQEAEIECDRARAQLLIATEETLLAAAQLELELQRLERLAMRAPFAGRVVRLGSVEGEMLESAEPVLTLVALETLEAEIHVPMEHFGRFAVGQIYRLDLDPPAERSVEATLRFASPLIDPSSRTFRCVFVITNQDERLPSGISVRLPLPNAHVTTANDDSLRR
jgi:RND family efflux transporter MFP subunit